MAEKIRKYEVLQFVDLSKFYSLNLNGHNNANYTINVPASNLLHITI